MFSIYVSSSFSLNIGGDEGTMPYKSSIYLYR
nr:MAG TPA: hypothetical protein [Caudoviricetes sp.]